MVLQGRCQLFLLGVFLFLLTPSVATAQYRNAPAANAPTAFIPFGPTTLLEGADRNTTAYRTPAVPYSVARHAGPSCSTCSQPGPQVGGETYSFDPSSCGGVNYPVAGQVDYSSCGNACGCTPAARPCVVWYASAAGLYLDRSDSRRVWTTYEAGVNSNQLMNTQDADTDFEAGGEFHIGRYVACNRWALDLGYWSINNYEGSDEQSGAGFATGVSSVLAFNDLEFAPGDPLSNYVDNSAAHRIYRENEIHNVELNMIEARSCNTCSPWSHQMLVGVRYFKFDEDLNFDALAAGGTWGGNGGLNEIRMSSRTKNDLIGAQIGCILSRRLGCKTNFVVTPKFGIYNNHIENYYDLRRGDGTAAAPSAASGVAGGFPVESSTDEISFLSEVNIGLQYQASCRWSLFGGYRVVAITGIGLADEQIPQFIVDIPEIAAIDTTGSLVLHGAYFGATRSF